MYIFFLVIYLVSFCLIAGGAFALVYANLQSINELNRPKKKKKQHPEAPQAGEEVMYVDLSRERLEDLYKQNDK
tara:strand:- start:324 stop:545 length:222 start_codon:yes stop_codon:yes gene_type:complete